MTETATPTVRVATCLAAALPRVYAAWLDPAVARRFLFATEAGEVVQCDIDARVGGHFTVVDRRPRMDGKEGTQDVLHTGVFRALEAPQRLVFEFSVPEFSDLATRVEVHFRSVGESTEVSLAHDLGPGSNAEMREKTAHGWQKILAACGRALRLPG